MILAQLSIYPLGEGSSLGRFVREGIKIIKESGYTYKVGAMSTAVEVAELQELFDLVAKIRQAQLDKGAKRLVIEMKVDDRHDKNATLKSKTDSALAKSN